MKKLVFLLALLAFTPSLALGEARFRPSAEGEVASDLELDLLRMPEFTWAMDPFLKVPGLNRLADIGADQFKLEAVTFRGDNPMAVVNDQVVHVGDQIGGRMVMRIEKDYVLLGAGGSIVEASLYDEDRQPASVGQRAVPAIAASPASSANPNGPAAGEGSVQIEEVRK